ncbi:MAG TPA: hypothetical protein VMO26_13490 [Vicinamibacterales bacterium]|nr:hypothetical protein [Vicinamibacterales bacterium]
MAKRRAQTVQLPYLIRDRDYLRRSDDPGALAPLLATPLQTHVAVDDGTFRDGPSNARVAVIDRDPARGEVRPGAAFLARGVGKTVSRYDLGRNELGPESKPEAFEFDAFFQVSPFATVLKTLDFFEDPQLLGRRVTWAFPSPQLLIVPRAGVMANAFYERQTNSLEFYYHEAAAGHTVYTALSHDIVVHEATHAILDGLAPDLLDAILPQSLALHEAIADLSAISQTLLNEMVVWSIENISPSGIEAREALSRVAEEFGSSRQGESANFLRRLKNTRTLDPNDSGRDEFGTPNRPDPTDLHALSQVLSGALYAVFEKRLAATHRKERNGLPRSLDELVLPAARRVARVTFRALDYLPPGEVSFADYGRAFLAAAAATYRRPEQEQNWLREEFVRRGIVESVAELDVATASKERLTGIDLSAIVEDEAAARRFAEDHRELLGLGTVSGFDVLPRAVASRSLGSKRVEDRRTELVFRVRWEEGETHDLGWAEPSAWAVPHGTTLVVEPDSGAVLSCLTTDTSPRRHAERGAMLRRWVVEGKVQEAALGPGERGPRGAGDKKRAIGRIGRPKGSVRLLHGES